MAYQKIEGAEEKGRPFLSRDAYESEVPAITSAKRPAKVNFSQPLYRVSFFVTGRCNMNCGFCSQKQFRDNHGDMDLAVAKQVIDTIKTSDIRPIFSVTGGEPTLWPHLVELFEYASAAKCFTESWMFSNGTLIEHIEKLIGGGLLDFYRTNAANCRSECYEIKKRFPENVKISPAGHYSIIKKMKLNSIPAECNCPGVAVQGDKIYACPNMYSITKRHKLDIEPYIGRFIYSVDDDWISGMREHELEKYQARFCMYCEANKKCQRQITDEKVLRYTSGI